MCRQNLSKREVEIGRLLINKRSRKEIADLLLITPTTVNSHIRHLQEKTGFVDPALMLDRLQSWLGPLVF